MEDIKDNRISKRFYILENLEYLISESVYYRSFSEDLVMENKQVLFNINNSEGRVVVN
jgi:hypothetical protein